MVHSINRKIEGGNVVLKVDMAKANNRVDWRFFGLQRVLGSRIKSINYLRMCGPLGFLL